ncbi:MAG: hypothetical protein ACKVPX_09995 [Myxococcaceae bacterium]
MEQTPDPDALWKVRPSADLLEHLRTPEGQQRVASVQAAIDSGEAWQNGESAQRAITFLSAEVCRLPALAESELHQWQARIDAGEVWRARSAGLGLFAKHLIDRGLCRKAPGVKTMWLGEDDRYEAIYSKEEVRARVERAFTELRAHPEVRARKKLEDSALAELLRARVADGSVWMEHGELPELALDALEYDLIPFPPDVRHIVQHLDGRYEAINEERFSAIVREHVQELTRFDFKRQAREFKEDLERSTAEGPSPPNPWVIALIVGIPLLFFSSATVAGAAACVGFALAVYQQHSYTRAKERTAARASEALKPKYRRVVVNPAHEAPSQK